MSTRTYTRRVRPYILWIRPAASIIARIGKCGTWYIASILEYGHRIIRGSFMFAPCPVRTACQWGVEDRRQFWVGTHRASLSAVIY
jgi:hypothetical protein